MSSHKHTSSSKASESTHSSTSHKSGGSKFFVNFEQIISNKYFLALLACIFILITGYISTELRSGQADFAGLRPYVESNVYAQLRSNIQQQIDSQYPMGTTEFKTKLVDTQLNSIKATGEIAYGNEKIKISDIVDQNLLQAKSSFQTPDGQTYLGSIDPYYYYALANNLYDHGYTGTKLNENGQPIIEKMLAPVGVFGSYRPEFNVWIIAKTYSLLNIPKDASDSIKFKAIFFLPVWLSLIAVIPCYMLIRKFSSDIFALLGTLICMSTGIFVSRTLAGSIDNDPYYVIMPLVVAALFVYAVVEKRLWLAISLAAVAGFFQGFMAWTLGNAWFILFFIVVSIVMYLAYLLIECVLQKRYTGFIEAVKRDSIVLGAYLVSSFIFNYVFVKGNIFSALYGSITGNIAGISGFDASNIWPNVLSSVAELNPASFGQIVSSVGGGIVFFLGLIGIVLMCQDFEWKQHFGKWMKWVNLAFAAVWFSSIIFGGMFQSLTANNDLLFLILMFLPVGIALGLSVWNSNTNTRLAMAILLSVWIAGTIYMSFNGVRFIMILGPAFAIAFAIALYYIAKIINKFCEKELGFTNFFFKNIFGLVIALLIFYAPFSDMYTNGMASSSQPAILFDRAWFDAMDSMRANSAPDAIVTSWWDFGHFFHAIGQRAITFDGASQTTPQAHWVGRLLMENNETVSRDILRMLVCGGNTAFDIMFNESKDATGGILVNKVISLTFGVPLSQKDNILRDNNYLNFTQAQVNMIMPKLACENPRESIFVTSGDMIGKATVWAHWGSWDFTKKYVFDNYKSKSVAVIAAEIHEPAATITKYVTELNQIAARSRTQNVKYNDLINQWFAPYPGYYPGGNGYVTDCTATDALVSCGIGGGTVLVSINGSNVSLNTNLNIPFGKLTIVKSNVSSSYIVGAGDVDAMLVERSPTVYTIVIAQSPLAGSLFTKLYMFNGVGTKHFDYISSFGSQTAGTIVLWKTNWSN